MVFLANFRVPAFGGRPELSVIGLAFMTVVICDRLTVWVLIFMFFFSFISRSLSQDGWDATSRRMKGGFYFHLSSVA